MDASTHNPMYIFCSSASQTHTNSKPTTGQETQLYAYIYIFSLRMQLSLLFIAGKTINRPDLPQRKLYTISKRIKDMRLCHRGMHIYFSAAGKTIYVYTQQDWSLHLQHSASEMVRLVLPCHPCLLTFKRALGQMWLLATFWLRQKCQWTWKKMPATNTMSAVTASKA